MKSYHALQRPHNSHCDFSWDMLHHDTGVTLQQHTSVGNQHFVEHAEYRLGEVYAFA